MSELNSLLGSFPDIALEAHGWDPSKVSRFSSKKMEWICPEGHVYWAIVSNRTSKGSCCPFCSGNKVLPGFNDLETKYPELAKQADGWNPTEYTSGSSKQVRWKCGVGHTWITSISHRTSSKTNCPYCAGQKAIKGQNDLQTTYPHIAAQADGWDPTEVISGSHKNLKWLCEKNHNYSLSPLARIKGAGCPYCGNRKVLGGFNDLQTLVPEIASQAFGWDPKVFMPGSRVKQIWKCPKDHTWSAEIQSRTRQKSGCPFCAGQKVIIGETDFASSFPELATEANGWNPSEFTSFSNLKKEWKCSQGHVWQAVISSRAKGNGCPFCSGKKAIIGSTDFKTTHPSLSLELKELDPETVTAGSSKIATWVCSSGHEWKSRINHRVNGSGCPSCANYGFDPNSDAWIYLLIHPDWRLQQIGISNVPEQRLTRHFKNGWELLDLRGPMSGDVARSWEASILEYCHSVPNAFVPSTEFGNFTGYTESWRMSDFEFKSVYEIMKAIEQQRM
jgi:hypothetical protein